MTVHSSKGLEFPVVFVSGLDDGLFPLYVSIEDKNELEEERRLFYVALTRAQERVFLLYATNRRRMGGENVIGMPSRFIGEIPPEFLDRIEFQSALTRRVVTGSKPAFSAKVLGIISRAEAKASMAICSLPPTVSA